MCQVQILAFVMALSLLLRSWSCHACFLGFCSAI